MSDGLTFPSMPTSESLMPNAVLQSSHDGEFLQSTTQRDSSYYSKEIIKGVVIVLPMVVALLLAPMLLSYSRRRLIRRHKSAISRLRCCCRPKAIESSRDDQRVIIEISEQNIEPELTPMKEATEEKLPMKPTLKKSKMFVESAGITSDPNETQVEEAEVQDVDMASGRCFPEISLVKFGAKVLDRRHLDEGQSTAHSRLTVFENNAYEDTIPSLVESAVDVSHASSPDGYRFMRQTNCSPSLALTKETVVNTRPQISPFPSASQSFLPHPMRDKFMAGTCLSQNRVRRHFSNKERWQPLYPKPKDPETVSMFGYEFANDVMHGHHVPPSPLLPAPFQICVSNRIEEPQAPKNDAVSVEYANCRILEKDPKTSSLSPQIYSPHVGAASTKLSSVSTKRTKRKVRKSRRHRDQLHQRWKRRIPVFNTGYKFGTLDSYGSGNNDKISGYIGNRSHRNMHDEDDIESEILRQRFQMSETTLLEEIWQHLKTLVERTNQGQDLCDAKEDLPEQHSNESSAHTVVPSTVEQLDTSGQIETSITENSSSGISVQMYPCLKESDDP